MRGLPGEQYAQIAQIVSRRPDHNRRISVQQKRIRVEAFKNLAGCAYISARENPSIQDCHVAAQRSGGFRSELSRWSSASERARAKEVLDFVGLTRLASEMAGNLSYGQQKLLEFACIIIARPRVILLDEPAGGINPTLLRHLASRIRALNDEGITFVVVEHDMEFVMGLCHKVCVMHQGRTLCSGHPDEVRQDPLVLEAYLGTDMRETDLTRLGAH